MTCTSGMQYFSTVRYRFFGINEHLTELKSETLRVSSCSTICNSRVSGQKKTNRQVRHESYFPPLCWCVMSTTCLFMALIQRHHLSQRICMSIVYLTPSGQDFCYAHGLLFTTVYTLRYSLVDTAETEQ